MFEWEQEKLELDNIFKEIRSQITLLQKQVEKIAECVYWGDGFDRPNKILSETEEWKNLK